MLSKTSGRVPSTEKHSKGSKNISSNISKGNFFERRLSLEIHKNENAVLISSKLLREFGCGQIDLCSIKNGKLTIFEVKSKPEMINNKQRFRLNRSLELLLNIFNAVGRIRVLNSLPKD